MNATKKRDHRIAATKNAAAQYFGLSRRACSLQEWIALKLSVSAGIAARRIREAGGCAALEAAGKAAHPDMMILRAVVGVSRNYFVTVMAPSILAAEELIQGMSINQIEQQPPAGPKDDPRRIYVRVERFDVVTETENGR